MKKSAVTSEAWNQVLQRDLKKVSRDQNNFNEVLFFPSSLLISLSTHSFSRVWTDPRHHRTAPLLPFRLSLPDQPPAP